MLAQLPMIDNIYTNGIITSGEDLFTEYVYYPGVPTKIKAYVASPLPQLPAKKYPAIVVIHDNLGLTPHIEDVVRRVAFAGYLAIAPDALSALGKSFHNEAATRRAFMELNEEDNLQNFIRVFGYLKTRPDYNGRAGCVGFCWGGTMGTKLAAQVPSLKAAVAYYANQPGAEATISRIKIPLQFHYAEFDPVVNASIPGCEEAAKKHHIPYEQYMYGGTSHDFHNDNLPVEFNESAAKLSWLRTLQFLGRYLDQ